MTADEPVTWRQVRRIANTVSAAGWAALAFGGPHAPSPWVCWLVAGLSALFAAGDFAPPAAGPRPRSRSGSEVR